MIYNTSTNPAIAPLKRANVGMVNGNLHLLDKGHQVHLFCDGENKFDMRCATEVPAGANNADSDGDVCDLATLNAHMHKMRKNDAMLARCIAKGVFRVTMYICKHSLLLDALERARERAVVLRFSHPLANRPLQRPDPPYHDSWARFGAGVNRTLVNNVPFVNSHLDLVPFDSLRAFIGDWGTNVPPLVFSTRVMENETWQYVSALAVAEYDVEASRLALE